MLKIAFAAAITLALSGCATASKYQADVQAGCDTAKAAAATPLATVAQATVPDVAQATVPDVAQATNLVISSCTTEEQIAALVNSPTSVAWLGTLTTTLKTGGKTVLPPPVSP